MATDHKTHPAYWHVFAASFVAQTKSRESHGCPSNYDDDVSYAHELACDAVVAYEKSSAAIGNFEFEE